MKTKINIGLGVLVTCLIIISYGFKNNNTVNIESDYQTFKKELKITGSELFQKNCAACHGVQLQGNLPTFPSLEKINQKLTKNEISNLLKTGRNLMPNFSHLSTLEHSAIIGYLFGESTEVNFATEISSIQQGENLFVANCARCHQPDAENSNSQRQMHMGMRPPVLDGVNNWVNISQFKQILNMGPCYMPSFAAMENKNKEDIYAYLSTLESSHQNSYYRMQSGCGMRMR